MPKFGIDLRLFAVCVLLLVVEGCAPGPTTVSGKITLDHRPISVPPAAQGTIIFRPDGGRGTLSTGLLDSTGNFQLATGSSMEVAPGNYFVTVAVSQIAPDSDNEEQGTQLITPAKYASARNSDLKADVKPGANRIDFDLTSGTVNETATSKDSLSPQPRASLSGETPGSERAGETK